MLRSFIRSVEESAGLRLDPLDESAFRINLSIHLMKKRQTKKLTPERPSAVRVRVRPTANHQRRCEQQSF